jgi:hypothetical protein
VVKWTSVLVVIGIGVGMYALVDYLFDIGWFAVLVGIGSVYASTYILIWCLRCIYYMPKSFQRPFYRHWKATLMKKTETANPLFGYPMLAFIDLELDGYFEKGGLRHAEDALQERLKSVGKGLNDFVNEVCERRIKELESKEDKKRLPFTRSDAKNPLL